MHIFMPLYVMLYMSLTTNLFLMSLQTATQLLLCSLGCKAWWPLTRNISCNDSIPMKTGRIILGLRSDRPYLVHHEIHMKTALDTKSKPSYNGQQYSSRPMSNYHCPLFSNNCCPSLTETEQQLLLANGGCLKCCWFWTDHWSKGCTNDFPACKIITC